MDLSQVSGLSLAVEGNKLRFGTGVTAVEPAIRTLEDMRPYLADPKASGPAEVYFMYRGVTCAADASFWGREHLRYDVTILLPGRLGDERVKTIGHYHPSAPGTDLSYTEVYQVLAGRANYLLQKRGQHGLDEVVLVEAGPGETLVIPPDYGHVTINAGEEPLVMANLVEGSFASLYGDFRNLNGAAYYGLAAGEVCEFRPNPRYGQVPELVRWTPARLSLPIYQLGREKPGVFRFLLDPRVEAHLD